GPGCCAEQAWTDFLALSGETVYDGGEPAFQPANFARVWRRAAESIHAVSHLEYSFRQHARDQRAGAQAAAIFAIQLSAVAIQSGYELYLSLPGLASQGGRVGRMIDFILEAWVSCSIASVRLGWVVGKGQSCETSE